MAPIGKLISNGKGIHSKDVHSSKKGKEDEWKEESSEDGSFHDMYIKVEEESEEDDNETNLYVAMNDDEGVEIKSEDDASDYEQKPYVDISDDVSCKSEKDDDSEKGSSQSLTESVEDTGKSLLCKVCGKQFLRAFYYYLHIKTHNISLPNDQSSNKPHKCQECGKTFALLQHLTAHSRTHIAGRYFECPVCRRKFTELSNLTMHLLKTHPDEKPYKCSECERPFTQSSALKKHMRTHNSITSQEEIDRIDMLFYVNNEMDKDSEEPMKKKIKLEKEDKISPLKEKAHLSKEKTISVRADKSPLKEKTSSKVKAPPLKMSTSPKGKWLGGKEKQCQLKGKTLLVEDQPVHIKEEYVENDVAELDENLSVAEITPVKEVISSQKPFNTPLEGSPLPKEISPLTKDMPRVSTSPKVLSQSAAANDSCLSRDKLSTLERKSMQLIEKEDSLPLRNGVQFDKAPNPPIKVMKFAKIQLDSEPLSVKVNTSLTPPFKSFSGSNENNVESQVIKEEAENENENENSTSICNGDRGLKGRSAAFVSLDGNKSNWFAGCNSKKSEKRDPSPTVDKPDGDYNVQFKCHRCEVFFVSEENLHEHLMDHTGVKLFECRFCGKDFTKMSSLKRHLYYHVSGNIPQDCTRCGKAFSLFKDLKDHCASKNCDGSANARFKCFRCRKQTSSLKRLKVHLLSQCNEDPVKYYVPKKDDGNSLQSKDCDTTSAKGDVSSEESDKDTTKFFTLASKWVTQKFEKASILSDPGLKFEADDVEALQILSEVDPTDKEGECWKLQCQNCGDKFENGEAAKDHTKLGHCKSEESLEKETLKIKVVFEEDEDLQCSLNCSECDEKIVGVEKMLLHIKEHIYERNTLTCPVLKCEKLFKEPLDFKLHLKAHTGHKPFKCGDCGKRFFLRENYENHAKRHGILKNWSSLNTIIGETGKTASARSPITIESTIANLEVSEPDVDRKMKWTAHTTTEPISDRAEFKSLKNKKAEKALNKSYPQVNALINRQPNHSVYKPKPPMRPSVVNKLAPAVNRSVPVVNRSLPSINRSLPAVSRPAPTTIKTSPPVNRPGHTGGFLSLTASFPVGSPRSFTVSSPANNKSVFSVASVSNGKLGLSQKDPNARVHPASYYRVSEHSRAHIQAANAELRKYPRSGRCEVCKKTCSRLDKHMMVHLNQKPHLCPVCPQAFRQSEHLRRHIRARHEGNHRQFECPMCHKRLTRKDKLKEHMKNCCRSGRIIDFHSRSSIDSHDGPVTLGDSLFDMIPGPHGLPLEGHRVE